MIEWVSARLVGLRPLRLSPSAPLATTSPTAVPSRLTAWLFNGSFAVLDEGLFAGANFLANILLARWCRPDEYGAFAVAFSAFLLLGALHTALLTEPMMVFGAGKYRREYRAYLGLLVRGHLGVALPASALLGVGALVLFYADSPMLARAFAGVAFASPTILLLWLLRRAFYVQSRPHWAAAGGALYLALMVAGIYAVQVVGWLSPASALIVMGLASLVVAAVLLVGLRPGLRITDNAARTSALRDHWNYGRWSVATTALMWAPGNLYYLLLPAAGGLAASGGLRALMNLVMPVLHANGALSTLLLPAFARAFRSGGPAVLARRTRGALVGLVAIAALYWVVISVFRHDLVWLVYGPGYADLADLVVLLGALPLLAALVAVKGAALRAMERPDLVFRSYVVAAVVAATVGVSLVAWAGAGGAVVGMLASSAASGAMMVRYARRSPCRAGTA